MYKTLADITLGTLIFLQTLTCIWIRIGVEDIDKEDRQSWIFKEDSNFNPDNRSIYDFLLEDDSYLNRAILYLYA